MSSPVPIAAEVVSHLGPIPITNTMINAWIATIFFLVVCWFLKRKLRERPKGLQLVAEVIVEGLLDLFDKVTGNREASKKLFPLAGAFFLFILFSNWLGLVPGVGSIGIWQKTGDGLELVPLFRSANSDLNLTLAMALVAVVGAQAAAIYALGLGAHLGKYFQFVPLGKALVSLHPTKILSAIIQFAIGLIEFVGEFSKVASLSLRLFGNIFAGEVLITSITSLAAYLLPLPFMGLELLVGVIQALFFAVLTTVYFTLARQPPHGESAH